MPVVHSNEKYTLQKKIVYIGKKQTNWFLWDKTAGLRERCTQYDYYYCYVFISSTKYCIYAPKGWVNSVWIKFKLRYTTCMLSTFIDVQQCIISYCNLESQQTEKIKLYKASRTSGRTMTTGASVYAHCTHTTKRICCFNKECRLCEVHFLELHVHRK